MEEMTCTCFNFKERRTVGEWLQSVCAAGWCVVILLAALGFMLTGSLGSGSRGVVPGNHAKLLEPFGPSLDTAQFAPTVSATEFDPAGVHLRHEPNPHRTEPVESR